MVGSSGKCEPVRILGKLHTLPTVGGVQRVVRRTSVAWDDAAQVLPQGVRVHVKSPLWKEEELVLAVSAVLKALKVLPRGLPEWAVAPVARLRQPHPLHHHIT